MEVDSSRLQQESNDFIQWDPSDHLSPLSNAEVHFSTGFLCADLSYLFQGIHIHWVPLFTSVGAKFSFELVENRLNMPDGLDKFYFFSVDSNPCVIGLSSESNSFLAETISQDSINDNTSSMIVEYLSRRLLFSLSSCWSGLESPFVKFENQFSEPLEIVGVIRVVVKVEDKPLEIVFGLDKKTTELIHLSWKKLKDAYMLDGNSSDTPVQLSVEVANIEIDSGELINSLVPGNIIEASGSSDLQDAVLRINRKPVYNCKLRKHKDCYALSLIEPYKNTSRRNGLSAEILQLNLPQNQIKSRIRRGSVLIFDKSLESPVQLVVEGEVVGHARMGTIAEGQKAFMVE